jgi:hypothetical protein
MQKAYVTRLLKGNTVEDLLREKDLSLDTAILKCRAQEAARKQQADIAGLCTSPCGQEEVH